MDRGISGCVRRWEDHRRRDQIQREEVLDMEENQMIQVQRPTQPEPWRDLDDLIFQGDGWLASDR